MKRLLQAIKLMTFFAISLLWYGCDLDKSSTGVNYIDTDEEKKAYLEYVAIVQDSIKRLSGDAYYNAVTDLGCDCLTKINLESYLGSKKKVVARALGKDSMKMLVTFEMHEFVGQMNAKDSYTPTELSTVRELMNQKCPDRFAKFKKLDDMKMFEISMEILTKKLERAGKKY